MNVADFPIHDDSTPDDVFFDKRFGRGHDPSQVVKTMFAAPSEIKLIPRTEWDARIDEQDRLQSSLWHIRMRGNKGQMIPSLNQGQWGYCWAHSTTNTAIIGRAKAHQPYVPLSAFSVAATIKNGRNEGGWCGLSAQFGREHGFAPQDKWSQGNANPKLYTPDMQIEMAKYKITEDFVDLSKQVYDQNLTFDMIASVLLQSLGACAVDFNWWSHSVTALRVVRVEAGSYGLLIWNSWGDDWGQQGCSILRGNKAIPDGAICTVQLAA